MAFDSARGRIVLFGGGLCGGGVGQDAWEWDTVLWVQRTPATTSPSGRHSHAMAFDETRGRIVVYGGNNGSVFLSDEWEYGAVNPAGCFPFGTGCAGHDGIPVLAGDPSGLPWVSYPFTAQISKLGSSPSQNVPFLIMGDSRTAWGPLPLPYDLSIIGMTGCTAYMNSLISYALTNAGGTASWTAPVPNDPTLVGTSFYAQAAVTAAGANPLGLALSNGLQIRFGAK